MNTQDTTEALPDTDYVLARQARPYECEYITNENGYTEEMMHAHAARVSAAKEKSLGECDECGTAYVHDATDGGSICVRCMLEKCAAKDAEVEKLKSAVAWQKKTIAARDAEIERLLVQRDDARFALRKLKEHIQGDCV